MAEFMGYESRQQYIRIERENSPIQLHRLEKLAENLNLSLLDLLNGGNQQTDYMVAEPAATYGEHLEAKYEQVLTETLLGVQGAIDRLKAVELEILAYQDRWEIYRKTGEFPQQKSPSAEDQGANIDHYRDTRNDQ